MHNRNARNAAISAKYWGKSLQKRDWYAIDAEKAEIRIYDVIGWPFIEAGDFLQELDSIKADTITVAINSPGGDVFDGLAIYNALKRHPAKVITRVDSLAASMASVIALAGDEVEIAKNAYFMIHNPWTIIAGDEHALRKEADVLAQIGDGLLEVYQDRTGKNAAEIKALMDAETWIKGADSVDFGFADRVTGTAAAAAKFDLSMFGAAPDDLQGARQEPTKRDIERALRDAGLSRSKAAALLAAGYESLQGDPAADLVDRLNQLTKDILKVKE
jgi:ATP-dependent protease ClpP protease subunit